MGIFTKKPKNIDSENSEENSEVESKKNKKKKEKVLEPQYYVSATNMKTLNYKVYYMSKIEKVLYFLLAFVVGAAVGYLFYGGIGVDQLGKPTKVTYVLDILISSGVGIAAGIVFLPMRTESIIHKRQQDLKLQFRELLDSLTTSLGSGKNIMDSFNGAYGDMKDMYEDGAFILEELKVINTGLSNNISIESMLLDMGRRSGVDDIISFANVFEICYRKGGNIRDVIKNTKQIISDKMEVEMEIETVVTSSKTEQNIMLIMPVALIGLIKLTGKEMASNYVTPAGLAATTIGVICFVVAYFVGKKILSIKV